MHTVKSSAAQAVLPHGGHPYIVETAMTRAEARQYCARLARSHYENFLVAGLFCPRSLRQHFYNVYAYCRVSDDLGDEIGDPQESLRLLDWWEEELDAMYAGEPRHPVFVALEETVQEFGIPVTPFRDLLQAFRQDQTLTDYPTYNELVQYCRYSANPVGRLVLALCGCQEAEQARLSDCTCTALQLANFWQDVRRDLSRGRIYLPREDRDRFGYPEDSLRALRCTPEFVELMRFEVERTRALFREGSGLGALVSRRVRLDVEMFTRGGLEVLRRIEAQGYDVLSRRPVVPRSRQLTLLCGRLLAGLVRR